MVFEEGILSKASYPLLSQVSVVNSTNDHHLYCELMDEKGPFQTLLPFFLKDSQDSASSLLFVCIHDSRGFLSLRRE